MSIFRVVTLACPACGEPVEFHAAFSVNADRRPDYREAILDGSFQREVCAHCAHGFRLEPELTYLDVGRGQWILVQPFSKLASWEELETQAEGTFDTAYGANASAAAQRIGRGLTVRIAFGWGALREKLVCAEQKLDDAEVELVKIALIRNLDESPLGEEVELRLVDVEGEELIFGAIKGETEELDELLRVPRSLYDEIASDTTGWQPLRDSITAGPFVDVYRLLLGVEAE